MFKTCIAVVLISCMAGLVSISCSEDITDCPSKMCIIAGGWQLTEVYEDGVRNTQIDFSRYRLVLRMPAPATDTTSVFTRVEVSGDSTTGKWSIKNNNKILQLRPESLPNEKWVIQSLTPRQLVLVITRDTDIKAGPGKIEFILEPF
jgi:hypothetical protein